MHHTQKNTKARFNLFSAAALSLLLVASTVSAIILPTASVNAADYVELTVSDKARSYAHYRAANECLSSGIKGEIPADAAFNGERTSPANGYWFGEGDPNQPDRKGGFFSGDAQNTATVSPFSGSPTGEIGCSSIILGGLNNYWNEVSPADLLKAIDYTWDGTSKWIHQGGNRSDLFKAFLTQQGVSIEYTAPTEYFLNFNAFVNKCNARSIENPSTSQLNLVAQHGTPSTALDGTVYTEINVATLSGVEEVLYSYEYAPDGGNQDRQYLLYEGNFKSCQQMASNITARAGAFSTALRTEVCNPAGITRFTGRELTACIAGVGNQGDAAYCDRYTENSLKEACEAGQDSELREELPSADRNSDPNADEGSTCTVPSIGWIVCPVITFIANLADGAFGFLADNLLRTEPEAFNTESGTYAAWNVMRNVANIAFVIVFLIIIFSQLTSLGISNYGVKKMLPRIVVAAILVNVSFFISQIAIDLSNILGYSIGDVMDSITAEVTGSQAGQLAFGNTSPIASGEGFAGIAGGILATAAAGVAFYAMLSTLIPILLAALVALIMILFILTARQALIILLVVLSPLAFVAFLLPNTEGLFKKWRQALTAMLLLFPIIALVFGASKLASAILSIAANNTASPDDYYAPLLASAVLVLPLFVVPILLKKSLDGIPALGQLANKFSSRANGAFGKRVSESYSNSAFGKGRASRRAGRQAFMDRKFAERVQKGGVAGALAGGIAITKKEKYAKNSMQRSAQATADKAFTEDVSAAESLLRSQHTDPSTLIKDAAVELEKAVGSGDVVRARAAQNILLNSGGKGIDQLHSSLAKTMTSSTMKNSEVGQSLRSALNSAGLKAKHNALANWAYSPADQTPSQALVDKGVYSGLNDVELAGSSYTALKAAVAAGSISADQAKAVMGNSTVYKDMEQAKKDLFATLAPPPSDGQNQNTGSGPGGLSLPGDDNFNIPRS